MAPTVGQYAGENLVPVANVINEAYSERWSLPPLVIEGLDWEPVTAPGLEQEMKEGKLPAEGLYAATEGGRVLSVAWGRIVEAEQTMELKYLATRRERRSQGLGTACLEALQDYARQQGCTRMRTARFVDSRLQKVCRYLEGRGFAVHEPEQMGITMQADIRAYQPRPIELPPGFCLTHLQPGKEEEWVQLCKACFEEKWTVERFRKRFGSRHNFDPAAWIFVEHEGKKVAMSGIDIARDPEIGRITGGCLEWVCCLPEYRGQGLGEATLVGCLNYAKPLEPDPLILITQYFRKPALGLYQKLGFHIAREHRLYLRDL